MTDIYTSAKATPMNNKLDNLIGSTLVGLYGAGFVFMILWSIINQ